MNFDAIKDRCKEEGDCWMWTGSVSPGDVPNMRLPTSVDPTRKLVSVRRWIAEQQGKKIAGLYATNTCQQKMCVCPDHVQMMTRKSLQKRAGKTITKNETAANTTVRVQARIRAGNVKIGYENAREIRASDKPAKQWAEELGCSVCAVFRVRRGDIWKDFSSPFAGLGAR